MEPRAPDRITPRNRHCHPRAGSFRSNPAVDCGGETTQATPSGSGESDSSAAGSVVQLTLTLVSKHCQNTQPENTQTTRQPSSSRLPLAPSSTSVSAGLRVLVILIRGSAQTCVCLPLPVSLFWRLSCCGASLLWGTSPSATPVCLSSACLHAVLFPPLTKSRDAAVDTHKQETGRACIPQCALSCGAELGHVSAIPPGRSPDFPTSK